MKRLIELLKERPPIAALCVLIGLGLFACSGGGDDGGDNDDGGGGDTKLQRVNPITYLSNEMALKVNLKKCTKKSIVAYARSGGEIDLCSRNGKRVLVFTDRAVKDAMLEAKRAYENEQKEFTEFDLLPQKVRREVKQSLANALMQTRSAYYGPIRQHPAVLKWYYEHKPYPKAGSKALAEKMEFYERLDALDLEASKRGEEIDFSVSQ